MEGMELLKAPSLPHLLSQSLPSSLYYSKPTESVLLLVVCAIVCLISTNREFENERWSELRQRLMSEELARRDLEHKLLELRSSLSLSLDAQQQASLSLVKREREREVEILSRLSALERERESIFMVEADLKSKP